MNGKIGHFPNNTFGIGWSLSLPIERSVVRVQLRSCCFPERECLFSVDFIANTFGKHLHLYVRCSAVLYKYTSTFGI